MGRPKKVQETVNLPLLGISVKTRFYCSESEVDKKTTYPLTHYTELQERVVSNGIVQEAVSVDYPITPDYVNSFEESTDFKKDFAGCQRPGRRSLGDITAIQAAFEDDVSTIREKMKNLKIHAAKIDQAIKQQQNSNTEVDNNAQ